ncbi:MAG: HlyD family secretion protein [Syntrophales bacterium]
MKLKKRAIVIFLLLFLGAAFFVYYGQKNDRNGELFYSGTIEATQSHLSFQTGGRVLQVAVREGEAVTTGRILAELDPAEFIARLDQARGSRDKALKAREQAGAILKVYQTTIPAEIARAEAGVRALQAQLDEVRAGARKQDIERARQAMQSADLVLADARKNLDRYETLFAKGTISEKERDAVRLRYETTLKEYERSKQTYDLAREGNRAETIRAVEARLEEGKAALNQAKSNLPRISAAQKDVEAAVAAAQVAQAALAQMQIQLEYAKLKAPGPGIVTSRSAEPGEVVAPGEEALTIADLSRVDLKIFVDETEIGKVKPGQKADVAIDTFPGRTFAGTVTFISPEGEFTPKIIQTKKERVKLVYLVKISIPNPHLELKSGMPADARLR